MLAANCDLATNLQTGTKIWTGKMDGLRHQHHYNRQNNGGHFSSDSILMASCTEIHVDENHFRDSSSFDRRWFGFKALDCVNGTLMPRARLPEVAANYTLINQLFIQYGEENKLDVDVEKIPYETDITIYNKTKVMNSA